MHVNLPSPDTSRSFPTIGYFSDFFRLEFIMEFQKISRTALCSSEMNSIFVRSGPTFFVRSAALLIKILWLHAASIAGEAPGKLLP
jgi:hypothetical protein